MESGQTMQTLADRAGLLGDRFRKPGAGFAGLGAVLCGAFRLWCMQ